MHSSRKRTVRLVVALSVALLLAGALIYTSFNASTEAKSATELMSDANESGTYQLIGKVKPGSVQHSGSDLAFVVTDRNGAGAVPVSYRGTVPDPFREGREIVIDVHKNGDRFVGVPDSLVTKCPSKFTKNAK